jgi:hypothetical protein
MILHTIYEVKKLSFFINLTLGNSELSNVKPILGGFNRGAGTGPAKCRFGVISALMTHAEKTHLPRKVRRWRVDGNMPKQA